VKILVSWLRDFVDVSVPPADLAWGLHLLGFEVASVEPAPGAAATDADAVIDFEITANRPDCLSVFGMAREAATRWRLPMRPAAAAASAAALREPDTPLPLRVTIEDADLCPRYAAAMADVRVGPSPDWMVRRLAAAGVRSINNVVDVTNYVLIELGHPMHAFDGDRLAGGHLVIRRARPGERLTTLDGQDRALDDGMLAIADAERPCAIAGVMGGFDAEVSRSTTVIVLESAYFVPASIRRTSRRLGLSTEASYRFERGADPGAPLRALARACALIEQIGAGTTRPGWIDAYPGERDRRRVRLRVERVGQLLGQAVDPPEIERILTGLGFDVAPAADVGPGRLEWLVGVPGWRGDVSREADVIEEVARHHGYEHLPATFPALAAPPAPPDPRLERGRLVQRLARAAGFSECCAFAFVERPAAAAFAPEDDIAPIANPLSEKLAVLRPSLLPGIIDSLSHNRRRERRDVRLFELGSRFTRRAGEVRAIGLAWTGAAAPDHWSETGRSVDFFDIKGVVEGLAGGLGLDPTFAPQAFPWLVAGRSAAVTVTGPDGRVRELGSVGQLQRALAESRGLPPQDDVYVAELDLDAVADLASLGDHLEVTPLARHPSVVRDLSVLVGEGLPAAALRATIHAAAPPTLAGVREFSRYQGPGVADGLVSLSFRLTFRSPDRTLTDDEVQAATDAIVGALATVHEAKLR
jgi:phenylalanyl-tRNA synthetase beta chain